MRTTLRHLRRASVPCLSTIGSYGRLRAVTPLSTRGVSFAIDEYASIDGYASIGYASLTVTFAIDGYASIRFRSGEGASGERGSTDANVRTLP